MSAEEREQGRKWVEKEIQRLAEQHEVKLDGPIEWHRDFDRDVYWIEAVLSGTVRRWKFSYEQLEDSLNDKRVRRELERTIALFVVPGGHERTFKPEVDIPRSFSLLDPTGRPLRVFLCHSAGDKPRVREQYQQLKADGFAPWLDEEDLLPGQNWREEIPKAVRGCDVVIVCLSKSSVTKEGYVQKEIAIALDAEEEKPEGTIFIVPARLEKGFDVPARLNRWQWVDLFEENGYQRLRRAMSVRTGTLSLATARNQRDEQPNRPIRFFNFNGSLGPLSVSGKKHSVLGPMMDLWSSITIVNYTQTPLKITPLRLVVNGGEWAVNKLFFRLKSDPRGKFERVSVLGNSKEDYELHFIFPDDSCPLGLSADLLIGIDNPDEIVTIPLIFS